MRTFDQLTVVNFSEILVFHIFELVDETQVAGRSFVVIDKSLFEIHHVFVRGFFGAVDVDETELLFLLGLDESQRARVTVIFWERLSLAHPKFLYYQTEKYKLSPSFLKQK